MTINTPKYGYAKHEGVHIYVVQQQTDFKSTIRELVKTAKQMYDEFGLWPTVMVCGKHVSPYIKGLARRYNTLEEGDWIAPNKQIHLGIPQKDILSGKQHDADMDLEWPNAGDAGDEPEPETETGGGGDVDTQADASDAGDADEYEDFMNALADLKDLLGG